MIRLLFLMCFFITSYTFAEENTILARYGEYVITNVDFERILNIMTHRKEKQLKQILS